MADKGSIPTVNGRGKIRQNGSLSVANANGKCPDCCCKPKVLAAHITENYGMWNLTPWQGENQATPGTVWRLRETSYGLIYGSGDVDQNGRLVDLPDFFRSSYVYAGYMQIEIGCPQENGSVRWP
ncbi:MAG: hypothetical protein FWD31_07070 [Planctomycetaceae bacterium]|nr:hypothetical protein [Planctomycetaceae bacterium]